MRQQLKKRCEYVKKLTEEAYRIFDKKLTEEAYRIYQNETAHKSRASPLPETEAIRYSNETLFYSENETTALIRGVGIFDADKNLLLKKVEKAFDRGLNLVLDLKESTYMDSGLLNIVIFAHQTAKKTKKRFCIRYPNDYAREI